MPRPRRRPHATYGGTPLHLPLATTLPASSITNTTASLNGSVNPQGNATSWWFAYGLTSSYGTTSAPVAVGAGSVPVTVGIPLTGLTVGLTYHFAVVAQSSAGTVFGSDSSFIAQTAVAANAPATVTSAFGSQIDQPHFKYPFTLTNTGAIVEEQGTLEEMYSCVRAIVACPQGACPELAPGFGVPDLAFANTPLDPTPLVNAVKQWEPRATETAIADAVGDPNLGNWQVQLTTSDGGR